VRLLRPRRPRAPGEGGPPLSSPGGEAAVRAAVIFIAVVIAGVMVRVFREILSPLVVATLLLLLIDALGRDLDRRFPRSPAFLRRLTAGAMIIAGFAMVILLLVFQGPPFAVQLAAIEPRLNVLIAHATAAVGQPPFTLREVFRGADPTQTFGRVFGAARSAITYAGLVMIYLGFLVASRTAFSAKLDRLYDTERHREQARRVFGSIRNAVEQYVRLVTFKALLIALLAFAVMTVLGVHSALFVAFLVFLFAFVPIVGAFAGALIPALVALAQFGDLSRPAIIIGGLGVGVFLIDNVLMPKLQGDELNIDPLLVLVSIGFWGLMLGPPGALLSTPLTVTVMAVAAEFDGARWLAVLISKDGEPLKDGR
jgi:predicted PurR-regulated permease PerM